MTRWTRGAATLLAAVAIGAGAGCSSAPDEEVTALCQRLDGGAGVSTVAGLVGADDTMAGALDAARRGIVGIRDACPQHEVVAGLLEQVVTAQPPGVDPTAGDVEGDPGIVVVGPGDPGLPAGLPAGLPVSGAPCGPDEDDELVCDPQRYRDHVAAGERAIRDAEAMVEREVERYRAESTFAPVPG